jgi:hypothetical protein
MEISPLAGKPADPTSLVDVPKLITAYYTEMTDPSVAAQRVLFGVFAAAPGKLRQYYSSENLNSKACLAGLSIDMKVTGRW